MYVNPEEEAEQQKKAKDERGITLQRRKKKGRAIV
jgi:hypothetical protein